jgi:hypothetical protein
VPDLIITNGDSAADLLAAAGETASILPWRDMLHEGPLNTSDGLEGLSDRRSVYLAERFHLDFAQVRAEFGARDAVMRNHRRYDRIEIWLEHDLYDQLQLLQILSFFAAERRSEGIVLVQADDFLGQQKPDTIRRFAAGAMNVSRALLDDVASVWADLCEPAPISTLKRLHNLPRALTFLGPALLRFLEELPAPATGLNRTETALMEAVVGYEVTPGSLFRLVLEKEEAAFMGDWSFFRVLEDLAFAREPLVSGLSRRFDLAADAGAREAYMAAPLAPTSFGEAVLEGLQDHIGVNGIERWWAGTRLSGYDVWRFDRRAGRMIRPREASTDMT